MTITSSPSSSLISNLLIISKHTPVFIMARNETTERHQLQVKYSLSVQAFGLHCDVPRCIEIARSFVIDSTCVGRNDGHIKFAEQKMSIQSRRMKLNDTTNSPQKEGNMRYDVLVLLRHDLKFTTQLLWAQNRVIAALAESFRDFGF